MVLSGQKLKLVEEAVGKFGISARGVELLRHNENITCKLTGDDSSVYALRIQQPVEGFDKSLVHCGYNSYELFGGEVELLQYMRKNGFESLQEPVAGVDGSYICLLSDGSPAMLLRWIEGQPVSRENVPACPDRFAELALKIHRFSRGFQGIRIHYDEKMLDTLSAEIDRAVESGHITDACGYICRRQLCRIKSWYRLHSGDPDSFGIVHTDLGLGNILDSGSELIPIDFSLSGYGPYAMEAAMLISHFPEEPQRRRLVETLHSLGEKIDYYDAQLFISMDILLLICTHHALFYQKEWFQKQMEIWCSTLFL